MLWLFAFAALATGLPPRPEVVTRDGRCEAVNEVGDTLRVTFDEVTGTCAPPSGPGHNSCSYWVSKHLDASDLVVRLQGCETPLSGRFVRTRQRCDDRPVWEWRGRARPGRRHLVEIDGGTSYGWFDRSGPASDEDWCPPPSREEPLPPTPVVVTPHSTPSWTDFPDPGFSVQPDGDSARLVWTPGRTLQGWVSNQPGAQLRSDPMPLESATEALRTAKRGANGLSIRFHHTQTATHFEGVRKRGKIWCTQVLRSEYELTLLPEGPTLRGAAEMRSTAPPERCSQD